MRLQWRRKVDAETPTVEAPTDCGIALVVMIGGLWYAAFRPTTGRPSQADYGRKTLHEAQAVATDLATRASKRAAKRGSR